jgi:hypothetical protein
VRRLSRNVDCQSGPHYIQLCPLPRSRLRCCTNTQGQVPDDNEGSEAIGVGGSLKGRQCRTVSDGVVVVEVIKSSAQSL